jgi:hypothetical protein
LGEYDSARIGFEARQMLREMQFYEDVENEPCDNNAWATFYTKHGVWRLVGNGEVTSFKCGSWAHHLGCPTAEKHGVTLDGDFTGLTPVVEVHSWCHRADCCVCYKYGWVNKGVRVIVPTLEFASRGGKDAKGRYHAPMGKIEHITASVPVRDWDLPFDKLVDKMLRVVKARYVMGGVFIFHAGRFDLIEHGGWYFSPHFHLLAFLSGGYPCRNCPTKHYYGTNLICDKVECSGFARRTRDLNVKDGWIVKVFGERESVRATAWYQLEHCTVLVGKPRFQPYRWFGSCGCRKMARVKVEKPKFKCPLCGSEMVRVHYCGKKRFVLEPWREGYRKLHYEFVEEDGVPVFEIAEPIVWRKEWE